mgnify:CR=1 FL=1
MNKICHTKWDTLDFTIILRNSDGTPIDITGATISFTVAKSHQETPIIQKTCSIIDAPNWVAQVSATALEMEVDIWIYKWEIQTVWPGWDVTTTPMQALEILPQLTQ